MRRFPRSVQASGVAVRASSSIAPAFASSSDEANSGLFALAAAAAVGSAIVTRENKADCMAIAAVVGKDNFDAR